MKPETILKKAIEKAVKGGYKPIKHKVTQIDSDGVGAYLHYIGGLDYLNYEQIIFSHDFAKAFYGAAYKNHLMASVISKDHIMYLKKFI